MIRWFSKGGYFGLFVFLTMVSSCTKSKNYPSGICYSFTDFPENYEYVSAKDETYRYYRPCYNPNNANEVVFQKTGPTDVSSESSLVVYNLVTQQEQVIYTGNIWYAGKWNRKNWIVFGAEGGVVYKIKSNGDSLTQLTADGNNHSPTWNYAGDKVVFYKTSGGLRNVIIDESGQVIKDSFGGQHLPYTDWSANNGLIAGYVGSQIHIVNDSTFERDIFYADSPVGDICWLTHDRLLFICSSNIYLLDVTTGQQSLFKEGCDSKDYRDLTVSPDKSKVVASVLFRKVNEKDKTIDSYMQIYQIDCNTKDEKQIGFP